MAYFPQMSLRRGALLLVLAGCLSGGCVSIGGLVGLNGPKETPVQIGVFWNHEVTFAPDPAHGGTPSPGLVGRVYIYGHNMGVLLETEGALHVELSDGSGKPALEQWNIDAETMKKFQRKDFLGAGYSVFLPWSTYRPELTHVVLKVAFQPKEGVPLYASPSALVLNTEGGDPRMGPFSPAPPPARR